MIQYLLESTNYTLKHIAHLSESTIKNIRTIYSGKEIPLGFTSELQLIRLYQIILEIQSSAPKIPNYFIKDEKYDYIRY
ncbi:hypothetical protein [Flavobacterium sp.]|uniref:hypothetical protein n=1 Tax=Flavobacterium sp. TaxID=239 RepID=UPI0025BF2D85|nr:hypothetical protein [Flavobacterium sp.]